MKVPDVDESLRPITDRKFQLVRVDLIDVVTSRGRGARQFKANVKSIADNGLYKPIVVNARDFAKTGRYELVCGEGRLRAHKELGRDEIKAEVVHVDLASAHIMALGENMTKCPPQSIEFAYALLEMHRQGTSIPDLERITGFTGQYVRSYLLLVQQGEERLIKGVERGVFTLDFAMRVSESAEGGIQHLLMDAFDKKMITARHVDDVRKILIERSRQGSKVKGGADKGSNRTAYSVDDLKRDIARLTKEKEQFVSEAQSRETRLFVLVDTLRRLRTVPEFRALLQRHSLDQIPELQGKYAL